MFYQQSLACAARRFPHAVATIDTDTGQTQSFQELELRVHRLASWLHQQGLQHRDRVALLLPNSREFLELTFACAYLGLSMVPLNHRLASAELDAILADCQPRILFIHHSMTPPSYPVPLKIVIGNEELCHSSERLPEPIYDPQCILGLFYTSGTSGKPKGVMLTHLNHVINRLQCASIYHFRPGDVYLHAAPMFHMADFQLVLPATSQGAAQVMLARFEPELLFKAIERLRVTHVTLIPTIINLITLHPAMGRYDLSSLRRIMYGGSAIAPEVVERCRQKLPGCELIQGYGMTETGPLLTLLLDQDHAGPRVRSCGQVLPGVELRITDESGALVPRGQPGVVRARGLNVMAGYWNKPEETQATLVNGWMNTGDVAYEDEDGYIYIVDRQKDMIITGGENVYPTEVEVALSAHPAVKEVAVVAAPDSTWGELVVACVHLRPGLQASEDELRSVCRERLAGYKVPKRFEFFAAELPKGGTGKILRRELRARFWRNAERGVN